MWRISVSRLYAASQLKYLDHTLTHPVALLWTRDQVIAQPATQAKHSKYSRRTSIPSTEFKAAIPGNERLQATLEPEPTQHSKPTFVWPYIARHVWLHLRPRVHWKQNRHNTANQHLSGHTSPDTRGYIKGRMYIGDRTDTTQQTNICLGIHRQTRVATFKSDMSVQTYIYCGCTITEPVDLFALSFHFSAALWNICCV